MFVGLLIIGEGQIFRLDSFFNEFRHTTLYLQPDTTGEEMVNDILSSAERNKVKVFAFKRSPRSTFLTEYNIYGTPGAEKYINENQNIFGRKYTSLFLGSISFTFDDLKNITGIENIHDFYVIGSREQVRQFKINLIDKYGGKFPKEGYVSNDLRNTIVFIWLLITSIVLLLSFYDVIAQKKENLIKVTMGERISKIIWQNILLDSFVFMLIFTAILYFLAKYTNVFFRFDISLSFFCALLFFNALLYLNLYFCDLKQIFSNVKGSPKILSLNYSLKFLTAIITVFIISSNVVLIFESYSLYKQKSFFADHADYYYIYLSYIINDDSDGSIFSRDKESANVRARFYREFFQKYDATILATTDGLFKGKGILANKHAFNYLASKIKKLKEMSFKKDTYFLLPKKLSGDANTINELDLTLKFFRDILNKDNYDVIYYDHKVEIVCIDNSHIYGSKLVENPVIIYDNKMPDTLKVQRGDYAKEDYEHEEVMYKITSDDEFNRFIEQHNLTDQVVRKTNVLENYKNKWVIAKRVLYINLIFTMLVLFLEFIIITSIIKLEYSLNAIELSVKKVMGHSMLERNRKIILGTIITTILSILTAVIITIKMELNEGFYLAAGGAVILLLELFVIIFYTHKIENAQIQRILKGGNL